jgi:Protein of unknown function (DUF4089)
MTKRAKSPKAKTKMPGVRASKTARSKGTPTKSARTKITHPKSARANSTRVSHETLDHFIGAAAHALALPVEPAWKAAIKANLEVTLRLAASFADFPLPDDAEPAPVFVA